MSHPSSRWTHLQVCGVEVTVNHTAHWKPPTLNPHLSSICFSIYQPSVFILMLLYLRSSVHVASPVPYAVSCELLLHKRLWVEGPLGNAWRYCRVGRWSILDHCSSTEQREAHKLKCIVGFKLNTPQSLELNRKMVSHNDYTIPYHWVDKYLACSLWIAPFNRSWDVVTV